MLMCTVVACSLILGGAAWRLHRLNFPDAASYDNPETVILIIVIVVFGYHVLALQFGTAHMCSIFLDVTSKDLASNDSDLKYNPPCCPGSRSLFNLVPTWRRLCCAPVRWRPPPSPGGQQVSPADATWSLAPPAAAPEPSKERELLLVP